MDKRINQCDKILRLLQSKHEVGLPEILPLAAQYNARLSELREAGHDIRNRTKRVDGVKHSWYRLVDKTEQEKRNGAEKFGARRSDKSQGIRASGIYG